MIFITGATGFIGRHLVRELYRRGYRIRCLVRDKSKAGHIRKSDIAIGDMRDLSSLIEGTAGCSTVIHLAAPLGYDDYKTNYEVTVQGAKNLIEACKKNGVRQLIFFSSIAVFIKQSNYGKTKLMAEKIFKKSDVDVTILRGDWIYGEEDWSLSKLSALINKTPFVPVPGDGKYRKRPIYVGDVVDAIIKCVQKRYTVGKTYMLGGPQLAYNEMLGALMTELGMRKRKIHLPRWVFFLLAAIFEFLRIQRLITKNNILGLTFDSAYGIKETEKELVRPRGFRECMKLCGKYYRQTLRK